jgi:uncharacterized membrane protein YozB (DUF420 family)/cytochrome oxidase Cu insertion factor (SCO1/SenC/PrrC family)
MVRLVAIFLLFIAPLLAAAQEKPFKPYAFEVRDFTLQEAAGNDFRPRDLRGKIWVAHFFFPGCTEVCTKTTPNMKRLQDHYRGKLDVRLVSIALNNDTLDTLQRYAEAQNAEPGQWLFLTGPDEKVHGIVQTSFWVTAVRQKNAKPGSEVSHSDALFLIDHEGNAVGYVEGSAETASETLKTEIDRLRVRRRLESRIPVTGADLPWFNALLNSSCTVLLLLGWIAIRLRYETLHKVLMLLALAVSAVFLASYLFYHFVVMEMEPTRFAGTGAARYVYLAILLSHTVLAIVVAPLALTIAAQGLRDARRIHVKLARWTLPMWLYVSVTGVVVYWMLYRIEW